MSRRTMTSRSLFCRCQRMPAMIITNNSSTSSRVPIATHFRTGPSPLSERMPSHTTGNASSTNSPAASQPLMNCSLIGEENARGSGIGGDCYFLRVACHSQHFVRRLGHRGTEARRGRALFSCFPLCDSVSLWPESELKHLHPIIPRVHRDHSAALVDRDGPGVRELPRVAAGRTPDLEAFAGARVDALHSDVAELA